MKANQRTSEEASSHANTRRSFLEELRESFTTSFAYDLFEWPSVTASSDIAFQPLRAFSSGASAKAERPAESAEADSTGGETPNADPLPLYTTTNSDIPVRVTGRQISIEDQGDIGAQTNDSVNRIKLPQFRADARFDDIDGSGYTVAVLDTGIDVDDPFFGPDANNDGVSDRIVYQYDFVNNDSNASDGDGHGTNVSSIIASSDGTYTGVAPGANIAALKVLDDQGEGQFSYVESALQWVINNAETYNIVSVNMSLGDIGNYNTPTQLYGIGDELATLAAMDIVVVSSSGNDFYGFNSVQGVSYPSADPYSLSVGSVFVGPEGPVSFTDGSIARYTDGDVITPYSQRSTELTDVFAPGSPVTGAGPFGGLTTYDGTSQAAPHVTGMVVLAQELAEQHLGRRLTFDELKDLIHTSGVAIYDGNDEDDNVVNTQEFYQRAHMLRLGEAILDMPPDPDPRGPTYFEVAALDTARPEGDSGTTSFRFEITRSGDLTEADVVFYDVSGSGPNPAQASDFQGNSFPSGNVTFAAGETTKTVTVQVSGDTEVEPDENFELTIADVPDNGQILVPSDSATIVDDDATTPGDAVVLIDADFSSGAGGTNGFGFVDGAFDSALGITTDPRYTNGNWTTNDVNVWMGGIDNSTADGISGGWERSFTLAEPMEVTLSFLYRLTHPGAFESDEFTQVVFSIDGGPVQVVTQINGDSASNDDIVIDPTTYQVSLGLLEAGDHTLTLGGYLNHKDSVSEQSRIFFDDVLVTGAAPPTTFLAIAADDAVKAEGDTESTPFTFTVTRSGDISKGGSVEWSVSGDASASDFAGGLLPNGVLTFANNQASKTLTILVAGDYDFEGDEAFEVRLFNPPAGSSVTTAVAEGTILNDDPAPSPTSFAIAEEFAVKAEGDSGSTAFTFTITRSGDTSATGSVDYQVGGNEVDGDDFLGGVLPSGTVTFAAGETEKTISIEVSGDTDFEPTEDFVVTLLNPSSGSGITVDQADGTIVNDDPTNESVVAILADQVGKDEGDAGSNTFTFTVQRSGNITGEASVDYAVTTFPGGSLNAEDFVGGVVPSGTVLFAPGESQKSISINVQGDDLHEPAETISVTLSNPSNGMTVVSGSDNATSIIYNDDPPPITTFYAVTAVDAVKEEGDSGVTEFTFTLTRSGETSASSSVDVTVSGNGADASDFLNGTLPNATVSFITGETSKTLTVRVQGDTDIEGDENFTVTLSNPSPGSAITTASAEGTILNDDAAPPATFLAIAAGESAKAEGDAGANAFTFMVNRSGDTSQAGTVDYAVSSGEANGADFLGGILPSGTVSFAAGEASKTVTVNVAGDTDFEGDEIFTVTLSNASAGSEITTASVDGTIFNDDAAPPATFLAIAAGDSAKAEGDAGTTAFTFTVTRSGDTSEAGSVDYAITSSEANGADFIGSALPSGTVAFAAGETSQTITVEVAGDSEFESDEDFTVTLTNPSAGSEIVTATVNGTIQNDDAAPPATFLAIAADDAVKDEGDAGATAFTFTVTRSGDTSQASTVDYAVSSGEANGTDFLGGILPSGTVSFAAGETSKTVTVNVVGDTENESDESFTVTLSNASAGSEITAASVDGTIYNDDAAPPATFLAIAPDDAVKAEGDAGTTAYTFTVTRTGDTSGAGSVDYAVTSSDADSADFGGSLPGGTVDFLAGETSKTVTVQVSGDTDFEGDEDFTVTLTNSSAGSEITTASADGTILNDDAAPPATFLAIAANDAVKAEGDSGSTAYTFTVTRSGDTSQAGSVDYTVTSSEANGADFIGSTLPSGTVSFAADEVSKTLVVDVAGDTLVESYEDFTVTLSNPSAGTEITTASAGGTIVNDDSTAPEPQVLLQSDFDGNGDTGGFVYEDGSFGGADPQAYADGSWENGALKIMLGGVDNKNINDMSGGWATDFVLDAEAEISLSFVYELAQTNKYEDGEYSQLLISIDGGAAQVIAEVTGENGNGPAPTTGEQTYLANLGTLSAGSHSLTIGGFNNQKTGPSEYTELTIDNVTITGTPTNPTGNDTFLSIAADDATKAEGDAGTTDFTFTVTRTGDTSQASTVDYAVSSGEANGADFLGGILPSGTVSFAAGETSKTVTVNVVGDTENESNEIFTVTLSNASAGSEITAASVDGTILNDDAAPPATFLAIAPDDAVKAEGDAGANAFTFTVNRSGDTSQASTVDYAVSSGEANGADFLGGILPSGTVSFAAGEASKTVTVNVAGDTEKESNEIFTVTLSNASAGSEITAASVDGTILNDDAPPPRPLFSITAEDAVKAEGDTGTTAYTFTVTRSGDASQAGSVDYAVTSADADGSDFAGGALPNGTVTFGVGESSKTLTIDVIGDTVAEGEEPFSVTLSNPSAGSLISTTIANGIILDDDTASAGASFGVFADSADKPEGDGGTTAFNFTVTRSGDTSQAGSVDYAVTSSEADGADFAGGVLPSGTISFAAGESSKTLTIDVLADNTIEGWEVFTVGLSNPSAGDVITTASATGTIRGDDFPLRSMPLLDTDFDTGGSGIDGFTYIEGVFGGTTDPTLTRGSWTGSDVTVVLGGGDASPEQNMSGGWERSFTLEQEAEVSLSFLYDIAHSRNFEADEFTQVVYSIDGGPVQVVDQIAGDAGNSADYVVDPTTHNVSLGVLSAGTHTLVIGGLLNKKDESSESSTISIDDVQLTGEPSGTPSFQIFAHQQGMEEDDGPAAYVVFLYRTGDASSPVSVDYSVSGGDVDGADFVGGVLPSGTVNFAAGQTVKSLSILIQGDTVLENDESFVVTLSNPSSGAEIARATVEGTIFNDDTDPAGTFFGIADDDAVKAEGDAGTTAFTFTVTRSGDTSGAGSVDYAVSGSAVDAGDFVGDLPSGTVSFAAGETSKTITIDVTGDSDFEGDEDFTVTLSNPSTGSEITGASAQGTIQNDDPAPPATFLAIADDDATKAEGDAGTTAYTFTVTRSGDTSGAGSVDYAVTSNEVDGSDFAGAGLPGGTVSFAAGETSKTITIDVTGDSDFEGDEDFTVTLTNPSTGSEITGASAQGTIQNDDPAPPATFLTVAADDAAKAEGDAGTTDFTFTVTRSGDTSGAGSVDYAVTSAEADGSDFAGAGLPGGTVNFAAGQTSQTITIQVSGDSDFEGNEDFTVTLTNPSTGSEITGASAQGIIQNDDPAPPATFLAIADDDATKAEGDAGATDFTFTVTRSGDTSGAGSVDYAVTSSEADANDFAGAGLPGGTVNFAAGETSKTITIQVSGDSDFEGDEDFTVTLSNASVGSNITTPNAQGTIQNDDPAPPTTFLAIAADDAVKDEGNAGNTAYTFTVTRSGDATQAGSVDYAVISSEADGSDFFGGLLPSGTANFAAGQTSQTITILVDGDHVVEGDEAFTVTLSNPSAGSTITSASANGTILNDDIGLPGDPVTVIDEDFDSNGDTGGFVYEDGGFGGGSPQAYADGAWNGGALRIDLGGVDNSTATDISGGWTTDFTLDVESEISLSFLYELIQSESYEADEVSQLSVSIDGGPPVLVASLTGDGNGGGAQTTGPQTYNAMLGILAAGDHSLTIGGFNNKKTWSNEFTELTIDDVNLVATPTAPPLPIDTSIAIASADAILSEGDDGSTLFTFIVTRSGDLISPTTVDYSVSGFGDNAANGDDFLSGLLPSGSVRIDGEGVSSATITIAVAGDTVFENDEGFIVTLTNPSAGSEIVTATAEGTILNDDPEPVGTVILIDADFSANGDTEGLTYSDGIFAGSSVQADADGAWRDGALVIDLGGGADTTVLNMAGAWIIDFSLAVEMEADLSFSYEMIASSAYEADESSQLLISVNGGTPILIEELLGDGNGGLDETTGLQTFSLDLGSLAAGDHSIAIGGANNKKTWSNEWTEITIDDVLLTASAPAGPSSSVTGGAPVGSGRFGRFSDQDLTEQELASLNGI